MLSIVDIHSHRSPTCKEDKLGMLYDPVQIMLGKITPEPQLGPQPSLKITPEHQPKPSVNIVFSNYDVLLRPSSSCEEFADDGQPILRFAPGNHVGNQRFRVLLSLYRQGYLQAEERGDAEVCARISRELMDAICHKCVPHGRFYEIGLDCRWQELPLGPSVVSMIRRALKNEPKEDSCPSHFAGRFPKPKRVCRRSSTFGSIVSHDSKDDRTGTDIEPSRFDVICMADGLHMKRNCEHTGNNRLRVMLDIRMKSYKKSNRQEKKAIAQEVVSSVLDDASSQFLRPDESSSEMYRPISREMAVTCIQNSFDANGKGKSKSKRQCRESEVKKLRDRKKKKTVLGRLERRKDNKCKLPTTACPSSAPPTKFKAFPALPIKPQQVAI